MKKEISIKHDTYMMTIHDVVVAIEELTAAKVVKLTVDEDNKMTFTLEYNDPGSGETEPDHYVPDYGEQYEFDDDFIDLPECKMCGKERNVNKEGYCSQCWQVWNS